MGTSSYKSVVTSDSLASWRSKYGIPSSVIMKIPKLSDRANAPLEGCVALNSAILHVNLRLSIPRVIRNFLSF